MKHGLKIKIAENSGFTKGFITRVLSEEDSCTPSWSASKIFGFVTDTDPVLWANKDISALEFALKDKDPSELKKYEPESEGEAA